MSEPARKKRKTNSFFDISQFEATEADEGGDDEDWEDDMDDDISSEELERHRKEMEKRYERRHAATLNHNILSERSGMHNQYESQPNILDRFIDGLQQQYTNNQPYW